MTQSKNLWGGRFTSGADPAFVTLIIPLPLDRHLIAAGLLGEAEGDQIKQGLQTILGRGQSDGGYFNAMESEDVHSFVETRLVEIIGEAGRKLHTGRSRNDQVATDLRFWLREVIDLLMSR